MLHSLLLYSVCPKNPHPLLLVQSAFYTMASTGEASISKKRQRVTDNLQKAKANVAKHLMLNIVEMAPSTMEEVLDTEWSLNRRLAIWIPDAMRRYGHLLVAEDQTYSEEHKLREWVRGQIWSILGAVPKELERLGNDREKAVHNDNAEHWTLLWEKFQKRKKVMKNRSKKMKNKKSHKRITKRSSMMRSSKHLRTIG